MDKANNPLTVKPFACYCSAMFGLDLAHNLKVRGSNPLPATNLTMAANHIPTSRSHQRNLSFMDNVHKSGFLP